MRKTYIFAIALLSAAAFAGTHLHVPTSMGRDYYIVFPKAAWGNNSRGVLVNSPTKQKVTVTMPTGQKGIIDIKNPTTQYYAGNFRIENDPEVVKSSEATRIQSPNPISVIGQFGVGGISGTYTALPVTSWGTEYYTVTPPEGTNSLYSGYPTIFSVPMITIIASRPGTQVTITPNATTATGHPAGVPFMVQMNAGDVYNVTTAGDPKANPRNENACVADLSGTHIVSSAPVGVIVAQTHTSWPCGNNDYGDYCAEWLPPVSNWDSTYVVVCSSPGALANALRIVFSHDNTDLYADDAVNGKRFYGRYNAGQFCDKSLTNNPTVFTSTQPILVAQFEHYATGSNGGPLSMVILPGVHQWSSLTPFSSAVGSQSEAFITFRAGTQGNLYVNDKSVANAYGSGIRPIAEGYAYIRIPVNPATLMLLRGDSGATAGGTVFGFGTQRYQPPPNGAQDIAEPQLLKSFAHSIGGNMTPAFSSDSIPPHVALQYSCGTWSGVALDDSIHPGSSGLYDIALVTDAIPDTSYNVSLTIPTFAYGDMRTPLSIAVTNLSMPAQATLRIRDGAGNEFDTTLVYDPASITATPTYTDVRPVMPHRWRFAPVVVANRGSTVSTITGWHFATSGSQNWYGVRGSLGGLPRTLLPGDSIAFLFQYVAPDYSPGLIDADTLLLHSCREFPVAILTGAPSPFSFQPEEGHFDFGSASIDTLDGGGDTMHSDYAISLVNIDAPHWFVYDVQLGAPQNMMGDGYPGTDYQILSMRTKGDTLLDYPSNSTPWEIDSGKTVLIDVQAHPHHSGPRPAYLIVEHRDFNNWPDKVRDTLFLSMRGDAPSDVADNSAQAMMRPMTAGYPNPFAATTTFAYTLPAAQHVRVRVCTVMGETVATLADGDERAGTHAVVWNAQSARSGMYLFDFVSGGMHVSRVVLKIQ